MSENNNEPDDSEREDKPSRLAIAGSRSNSLAEKLKNEDWKGKTGKPLGAGSRSISLADNLDNNKQEGKDNKKKDSNQDDNNTSNQT